MELISLLSFLGVAQVYVDMKLEWQVKPGIPPAVREEKIASLDHTLEQWRQYSIFSAEEFELTTTSARSSRSEENYTGGQRGRTKQASIVLIVDRNCGSQCEFLVSTLRHHPKVKAIIGAPTAGRLNFASNGSIYLPNTKIQFIPSRVLSEHDPRAIEGEGIHPDEYVLSGDPKEIAVGLLRNP